MKKKKPARKNTKNHTPHTLKDKELPGLFCLAWLLDFGSVSFVSHTNCFPSATRTEEVVVHEW